MHSSPAAVQVGEEHPPVRIVLADDAYLVREAVKHLFEGIEGVVVVGECGDAHDVPRVLEEQRADVLITDIRMPPLGEDDGIRLAAQLRATHPALGIIVLSMHANVAWALKLFESGYDGRGYLLKDRLRDRGQLLDAVITIANSGSVVDPQIVQGLIKARLRAKSSGLGELTPRERETLALVAEGRSNTAIADSMVLTKRAVEKHVHEIFAKLELGDSDQVDRRVKAALLYLTDQEAVRAGVSIGGG